MKYSGIDLHSNNSVVVVSDEADRVLVRRRVTNDATAIQALLATHREELVGVVVERREALFRLSEDQCRSCEPSGLTGREPPR